jgi:uncharacterized protein (UPF0218 family)
LEIAYRLNSELRKKLHYPFGKLLEGSISENIKKLDDILNKIESFSLILVGDMVSRGLSKKYSPKMIIIDNRCMRQKITPTEFPGTKIFFAKNPPGTITKEAIEKIKEGLKSNYRSQIVIEGEEDLLTLIVVLHAPENTIVIYGQPNTGLVLIRVTEKKKREAKKILKEMKLLRKAK